jgi:hypothetical protein
MIDPMANLDAPMMAADDTDDEKGVIDINTLRYNLQNIDHVRSVMGIVSGCVAGICGLTGWEGLGMFLAVVVDDVVLLSPHRCESDETVPQTFHRCCSDVSIFFSSFSSLPIIQHAS